MQIILVPREQMREHQLPFNTKNRIVSITSMYTSHVMTTDNQDGLSATMNVSPSASRRDTIPMFRGLDCPGAAGVTARWGVVAFLFGFGRLALAAGGTEHLEP
jgi:hypothetical protein